MRYVLAPLNLYYESSGFWMGWFYIRGGYCQGEGITYIHRYMHTHTYIYIYIYVYIRDAVGGGLSCLVVSSTRFQRS